MIRPGDRLNMNLALLVNCKVSNNIMLYNVVGLASYNIGLQKRVKPDWMSRDISLLLPYCKSLT